MRPPRLLAGLVLVIAAACSSSPTSEASSTRAPSPTSTSTPPVSTRTRTALEETTTTSRADRICAEIQDPGFDLRPLGERQFIREACKAEREAEAQEELLRESGALDPPEPPDVMPSYEPDYPEPEYPEPEPEDPGYP